MNINKKSVSKPRWNAFRLLFLLTALFMILAIFTLVRFEMDESVIASGIVKSRQEFPLKVMVDGKLSKICFSKGDRVKVGDLICQLDDALLRDRIAVAGRRIEELTALSTIKRKCLHVAMTNPLPKEYRHSEIILIESGKRLENARGALERQKKLRRREVISQSKLEEIELIHHQAKAQYEKAMSNHQKVKDGLGQKIIDQIKSEIKHLNVLLECARKRSRDLRAHLNDYLIFSPVDGEIVDLPYCAGCYMEKGETVARLSASCRKTIISFVDQKYVSKIFPGQTTKIISRCYDRFKFGFFPGKVMEIGEIPIERAGSALYPVKITLTDEPFELKNGSAVEVRVLIGKNRMISVLTGVNL